MARNRIVSSVNSPPEDQEEFRQRFHKQVFRLLIMGYERLNCIQYVDAEETDITGELVQAMRAVVDTSSPSWISRYAIHDDPPVNEPGQTGRTGKRRKRIDIEIERTQIGPHQRFSFEAKRLKKGKYGVSDYLGENGIGEFIAGNYAKKENVAGMLGYCQSDTLEYWATKIDSKIKSSPDSLELCKDGDLFSIKNIYKIDHCYRSKHRRNSVGREIDIYHILLKFF